MRFGDWMRLASVLCTGLAAGAQTVKGPALGLVVDRGKAIRPVTGIPGAASIGAAIPGTSDLAIAAVSPRGDYVAAVSTDGDAVLWTPAAPVMQKLAGITPGASSIVLSPLGSAAAFYFPGSNRVQVITGLPKASEPADILLTPLTAPLASFALSDDGSLLLCAETSAEAVVLSASGDLDRITLTGLATAVAFAPGSHDGIVVSTSQALLVRDAGHRGPQAALPPEGIAGANAAAFSSDATRVYFTHRRAGTVAVYRLAGGEKATVLPCDCRPAGLFRMGSGESYRLNEYSGAPVRLLDGTAAAPRIVAIPPAVDAEKQQ